MNNFSQYTAVSLWYSEFHFFLIPEYTSIVKENKSIIVYRKKKHKSNEFCYDVMHNLFFDEIRKKTVTNYYIRYYFPRCDRYIKCTRKD